MSEEPFEVFDFDIAADTRRLANRHRLVMAKLVLSFALLDTHLSNWIAQAFDMRSDRAALLLQNMTLSTKIQKLIKLFEHEGRPASASVLKIINREVSEHSNTRNLVCHAECVGVWRKDADYVIFVPLSYIPGRFDGLKVEFRSLQGMEASTAWADEKAGIIIDAWTSDPL